MHGGAAVLVLHKAGWIDAARHDAGLVVWPGGIVSAAVMTYRSSGAGRRGDVLAGDVWLCSGQSNMQWTLFDSENGTQAVAEATLPNVRLYHVPRVATAAPVGWWSWLARTLPDDAEAGGGLMVAVVQLSIASGSTVGGLLFDGSGYRLTFFASAALLVLAALMTWLTSRQKA